MAEDEAPPELKEEVTEVCVLYLSFIVGLNILGHLWETRTGRTTGSAKYTSRKEPENRSFASSCPNNLPPPNQHE